MPSLRIILTTLLLILPGFSNPLSIPASTAYLDPDSRAAQVRPEGITHWKSLNNSINWYGKFTEVGKLDAKVELTLAKDDTLTLKLTVGNQTSESKVTGNGDTPSMADFGEFQITKPGFQQFSLTSSKPGDTIKSLILDGPASIDAHFNMKPRRNAASVHLSYPIERGTEISAFYCEMTGVEDPLWTYYMACGWHRGYFGMQVNSPTERRIIFSVWDSGGESIDRKKVGQEDRVTLIGKGEGVYSGDFGNEGTGGHSHLKYLWKTGEKQKFLVTAEPVDETHTIFAGYYFHPDKKDWMLISSWKAPKEGKRLRGLYSFSENFAGQNGHVLRKALYGNQWIRTSDGKWHEITKTTFSHDGTGKSDRLDRYMGLGKDNQFF
ncbi:DUF3472 domain-containing protein, partial [Akkermansiaceae bacterium]|nr:DUF3472 domain-containing protein [Akkermansiaceae bacterium]